MATRKTTNEKIELPAFSEQELTDMVKLAKSRLHEAFSKITERMDPDSLAREAIENIKSERRSIVIKLLGLDDRWGRIEVDHCNNQKTEFSTLVENACRQPLNDWFTNEVLPELKNYLGTPEVKKAVMDDFKSRYNYALRDAVQREVENLAKEHASALISQFRSQMTLKTEE
jgi:translation initiation factor 2 alpha subunit (eIF-2alpha)